MNLNIKFKTIFINCNFFLLTLLMLKNFINDYTYFNKYISIYNFWNESRDAITLF